MKLQPYKAYTIRVPERNQVVSIAMDYPAFEQRGSDFKKLSIIINLDELCSTEIDQLFTQLNITEELPDHSMLLVIWWKEAEE